MYRTDNTAALLILGLLVFADTWNRLQQVQRQLYIEQVRNRIRDQIMKKLQDDNDKLKQEKLGKVDFVKALLDLAKASKEKKDQPKLDYIQ